MDQIEAMRIYSRVAELGSFTATAENLGLLKSTVSNAVQQLESALGTRLFHRTTRKVQLTQDGQAYYERCRDLDRRLRRTECAVRRRRTGGSAGPAARRSAARVRARSGHSTPAGIPGASPAAGNRGEQHRPAGRSGERGLRLRAGVGAVGDHSLIAVPLGRFEQFNCASLAYLEQHGTPRTLADLSMHRLVHYAQTLGARPSGFEYVSPDSGEVVSVPMQGAITVDNSDAYREACRAGLGIIQAPRVGRYLNDDTLVEILPDYRAPSLPISLVYADRRHLPLRVKAFIEWMKAVMSERM